MIWRDGTSEKDKNGLGENFLPQRKRFRHDIEFVLEFVNRKTIKFDEMN
jgi:hypothetical protein